jgi:hypothetical protein
VTRSLEWLLDGQRALRDRFEDFAQALRRNDKTALDVALLNFEDNLRRWTEAEETALIPAVTRVEIPGRDPRRELRLEYVQLRELTNFIARGRADKAQPSELRGYVENLDRRLTAHERENRSVYYPAAAANLTEDEWAVLEAARPSL